MTSAWRPNWPAKSRSWRAAALWNTLSPPGCSRTRGTPAHARCWRPRWRSVGSRHEYGAGMKYAAGMKYVAGRLLHAVFLLFGISVLSFLFSALAPGDYFSDLRLDPRISPETIAGLRSQYGLDRPLPARYRAW